MVELGVSEKKDQHWTPRAGFRRLVAAKGGEGERAKTPETVNAFALSTLGCSLSAICKPKTYCSTYAALEGYFCVLCASSAE